MQLTARTVAVAGAVALAVANLGRVPAGALAGRNAPITLADLVVLAVWLVLFLGVASGRVRVLLDRVTASALAFVAVAALSTLLAFERYGLGLGNGFEVIAFFARWVMYFGWYPFVAWCLTSDEARDANRSVDAALFFICAFGILQAFFLPEFGTRVANITGMPAWEYQGRRLVSTLLDPNFAGAMAVLALLPRLALVAEGDSRGAWYMLVPAVAVVLTASRSSVLALAVGVAVIVIARGLRRTFLKTLAAGGLLVLPLLPLVIAYGKAFNKFSIDLSAAQRLVTWRRALTLFLEHPLLGIGFNATRAAQQAHGWVPIGGADTGFDGGILFVMVLTGVIGAALYLSLLGSGVLSARRAWRDTASSAEDRAHGTATAASTIAILAHSFFSNSLLLPFVMQVLWTRFGRLSHIAAERRARFGVLIAVPLVMSAASCGPCNGVTVCQTDFNVRLQGAVANYATGAPVAGAKLVITLDAVDGPHQYERTTAGDGSWDLRAPLACCQTVRASVLVRAPGQPGYVVPDIAVEPTNVAGDAVLLGTWLDKPFVRYGVRLMLDRTTPLARARVTFQRTGGVPFVAERLDSEADGAGIFHMDLASDRMGSAIGTLTIQHPSLPAPWVLRGMEVAIGNVYQEPRVDRLDIYTGPKLGDPNAP